MKKITTAFCACAALVLARYVAEGGQHVEHLLEKCIAGGFLFICIYILYISTEEPRQ